MSDRYIESVFPACATAGYVESSPATSDYNCFAWAAGQTDAPWWPTVAPGNYWPLKVPPKIELETFIQAFQTLGYAVCEDAALEPGYEKIAFYASGDGIPTHAARQLPDGRWTSKLGRYKDIVHATLAALESCSEGPSDYGRVVKLMKRHRGTPVP
jgi:hypothetical protein